MTNVKTTGWMKLVHPNPLRNRIVLRNTTPGADVYLSIDDAIDNSDLAPAGKFKLIGIDEIEMLHHKGTIWAVAGTADAEMRILEE